MSFAHPWCLWLLVLPLLLGAWEWTRPGHAVRLPFDHGAPPLGHRLRRAVLAASLLPALLLGTAILIAAGPQRSTIPGATRTLKNIQFCLDVSGSMMSPFGDGTRADKAVQAIIDFSTFRTGDAFGLTLFGNEVLHWIPLTTDLSALRLSAPFLKPDRMPRYMGGTQIGKALREVRKVLLTRSGGDRMVILISDGESADLFGGVAAQIGGELAQDRITLYYIHVAEGAPQAEALEIASLTGGEAFAAGDPASLREVFRRIDAMQPAKLQPAIPVRVDHFKPLALAGLLLLGLQGAAAFGLRFTPW
ncbi:MAG TPA: aerotolerance regulator BatA [Verrucomicrobiales bacterium]|nr:aerotolerance regulator BatA [Verrucomicrobiales bacterium]